MVTMELGGNISLSGFSDRDFTEMIVIKKMVGQYSRKLTDGVPGFTKLSITMKEVHGDRDKIELIAKADVEGHTYSAEVTGHNIFIVLDDGLKHVTEQIHHALERQQH